MNKNQFIQVCFFLCLLVALDWGIGTAIQKSSSNYRYDKRIENVLSSKVKPNILVIGSSRALNNYDTKQISNSVGELAFNLGVSGTNTEFHSDLLEMVIASGNIPSVVIYNLDDSATLFETEGIIYREEEFFCSVEHAYVNELICARKEKSVLATKMSKSFRQNVNLADALSFAVFGKQEPDYHITNVDKYGANLMKGSRYTNVQIPDSVLLPVSRISPLLLSSLKKMDAVCKANNIRLVLVLPPTRKTYSVNFKQLVLQNMSGNTEVIDLTGKDFENRHFYNRSHLNEVGAKYFTSLLLNELNF